ncbi:DoxX family protein [Pseudomonas sp. P9_31]|uniref:DoxX family protein n=1 Tax=Pseudomonas sp. P9_31 TaxID=3043448 RepID=UPI002A359B76|nr:DoxX family protein [Pseudomonas sp. P9_31]WPN60356.1 DoxX family protein [Pseudomonas sp. P9_31]
MIENYVYWISTALLSLLYFASASMYVAKGDYVRNAQAELGYSASYLVPFMIVVKVLGPAAILWRFNVALSDLAYVGMFYHLLLSALAHLGVRKPKDSIPAVVGLILLVASFMTQNAVRDFPSPYPPLTAVIQTPLK